MLNMLCGCRQYDVGVTVVLSFMLAGFVCRTLSGALIDLQAWIVIFVIKFLRFANLIEPTLVAGIFL